MERHFLHLVVRDAVSDPLGVMLDLCISSASPDCRTPAARFRRLGGTHPAAAASRPGAGSGVKRWPGSRVAVVCSKASSWRLRAAGHCLSLLLLLRLFLLVDGRGSGGVGDVDGGKGDVGGGGEEGRVLESIASPMDGPYFSPRQNFLG